MWSFVDYDNDNDNDDDDNGDKSVMMIIAICIMWINLLSYSILLYHDDRFKILLAIQT